MLDFDDWLPVEDDGVLEAVKRRGGGAVDGDALKPEVGPHRPDGACGQRAVCPLWPFRAMRVETLAEACASPVPLRAC